MEGHVPSLHGSNSEAYNESKVLYLLQFWLSVSLVVQNETLTHVSMLVALILCWDENREDTWTEFTGNVFHELTVWSTSINAAFPFEVGSEDSIISSLSTPPILVILLLLVLHFFEKLCEQCITITTIYFAINRELSGLEPVERYFNARFTTLRFFWITLEELILDSAQQELVRLAEL